MTKILCAALHYDNGIVYPHQPDNISTGFVICGRRHHNAITTLYILSKDKYDKRLIKQGFLTEDNNYVDRYQAATIAYEAGQIKEQLTKLFSEDLY